MTKTKIYQNRGLKKYFVAITAKNFYQKPNPWFKTQFKENLKCFINRKPSTATNWGKLIPLATTTPPVPQSIQSEAEFIDQDKIFVSKRSQRVNSTKELNDRHLQSYFDTTQSLKGQQKLPPSLIIV